MTFICCSDVLDRLKLDYTLNIKDETQNNDYILKYPGVKSILDVKTDVYTFTNIPTRHQVWTGWPESLKEESTLLGCSGIDYPTHSLSVRSSENSEEKKKYKRVSCLD